MIGKILKGLFPGPKAPSAPQPAEPVDYEGFVIVAAPREVPGGWSTEGIITKTIEGDEKREHFIRADTTPSRDAAIDFSRAKARKIIDEQGERLFRS